MGLSARAIAPHLGVSHTAINKAARRGRIPKEPDGSFDLEKVRVAWDSNVDVRQQQRGLAAKREKPAVPPPGDPPPPVRKIDPEPEPGTLAAIQIEQEKLKLQAARVKVAREEGGLVDAQDVARQIEARFAAERQALLAWPSRIAGELAAEFGVDDRTLRKALDVRVRTFLAERSRTPKPESE